MSDHNGVGHEGNVTPGITELPNGEEGLHGKVGNDMAMAGRKWKSWTLRSASWVECRMMPDGV